MPENMENRTEKGKFSFQFQKRALPKNVQITPQLRTFHMVAKKCSKFSKPGFNCTWTEKFQMFKLDLDKAEEPKNKLPTFIGSQENQENSRKTSIYFTDYTKVFACVKSESESHSVVSKSLWPHGLYRPWNSPGQNTGVGSLSLLQGIFPTQGLNSGLQHCWWIFYQLSHKGSLYGFQQTGKFF